jgi:hypothetical protein
VAHATQCSTTIVASLYYAIYTYCLYIIFQRRLTNPPDTMPPRMTTRIIYMCYDAAKGKLGGAHRRRRPALTAPCHGRLGVVLALTRAGHAIYGNKLCTPKFHRVPRTVH